MDSSSEAILDGLDEAQLQAATTLQGPVRIVAGAGAGKTRTITRRIAYACAKGEWQPGRALAVTFSVKAAAEMRSRLAALGVGDSVTASTFHSAALRQLRRVWSDVCDAPFPHMVGDSNDLVRRAIRRVDNNEFADDQVRAVLAEINWCKISLIAPDDYPMVCASVHREPPAPLDPGRFADVYGAYEQEKAARSQIDFDDILLMACHVLDAFDEAAAAIRSSIGWLTVDEYQDVSPLQHHLMRLWLGGNRNVCVVGDPAQTIYSFAGASSYDLIHFADEFAPVSADISLNNDYRSVPPVVNYANRVLSASPIRDDYLTLVPVRRSGVRVARTVYDDDLQEARGIVARMVHMTAQGARLSDFAVLTRINAQQHAVCRALREAGLRYRVRRDSGWHGSAVDEASEAREALIESLQARSDSTSVTISTIHACKGMEFRHVFVIGCSEGLIPYGSPSSSDALEEERRLMYVAVTRAQDSLYLSYARRKDETTSMSRTASRFLR